jgi:hypothetical protein
VIFGPERWSTAAGADWSYWDLWFCVVCLVVGPPSTTDQVGGGLTFGCWQLDLRRVLKQSDSKDASRGTAPFIGKAERGTVRWLPR